MTLLDLSLLMLWLLRGPVTSSMLDWRLMLELEGEKLLLSRALEVN